MSADSRQTVDAQHTLHLPTLLHHLGSARDFYQIQPVAVCESTNSDIKRAALAGEPEGLVIIADRQTAGRGRMNRAFFSPEDTGLYMSVLLRPKMRASDSALVTAAAAVAAAEAIEAVSQRAARIKWVNDIFLGDKKVCGILAEGSVAADGALQFIALGIGINVQAPSGGFPDLLSQTACAVFDAPAPPCAREHLAAAVLKRLHRYRSAQTRDFLPAYRERSMVIGKPIHILSGDHQIPARALAIDEDCRLVVETKDGIFSLCSGEISIRLT